ncbi:MAG: type II toxin-antitoxin system VapC family toxin [Bryobacter sp.]|nr:type II toxin-antitoxin system VapC family toxin [Bryobacter sp.]
MIILDTNVLSEILRPVPSVAVLDWFEKQSAKDLCFTAITEAEMLHGFALLPVGKRRGRLEELYESAIRAAFPREPLPFTSSACPHYAEILATARRLGQPIAQADAMIAAIARANQATLATRNTRDFLRTGVKLVDPWKG